MRDLARVWANQGGNIIEKVATDDPSRFFAVASTLIPKDVAISIERRLPGGLPAEDWAIVMEVMNAVKASLPDANARRPGEVMEHVLKALRAYDAKTIEGE